MVVIRQQAIDHVVNITVPSDSRLWEPLAYPLLFPHATLGWGVIGHLQYNSNHQRTQRRQREPLSLIWHTRQRVLREPRFLMLGRVTNEYLVDQFSRFLERQLRFVSTFQTQSRQNSVADAMNRDPGDDDVPDDENIYLPSSFIGSRSWCSTNIANALALAQWGGPPDAFITITTNPNWPEIQSQLRPGQNWGDIPTVVARVFHAKLQQILFAIKNLFCPLIRTKYILRVIEFQKRGLPHAHVLIKWSQDLRSTEVIDRLITASLPEGPENITDAALMRQFMLHSHGPINGPLMKCQHEVNGVRECKYGYPQAPQSHTIITATGKILYKRQSGSEWVVPTCLPLLRAFQCHINVESAANSHIIAYVSIFISLCRS
jgi:Helitron helicase-like domain at N-terminus